MRHIRYDPDLACALADAYFNGAHDVLNELLNQLVPLIDRVAFVEQIGFSIGEANLEVLKADALEWVFVQFNNAELIPTHDPWVFSRYLWTMIKNAMLKSLEEDSPDVFEYAQLVGAPEDGCIYGRVLQHSDVDNHVAATQLREAALRILSADIRFDGRERKACMFMATCMLGMVDASPGYAKFRYRISPSRFVFLESYTVHLLQVALETAREIDATNREQSAGTTRRQAPLCTVVSK